MPAIIYDFKAIGAALRKQRIDDWWQPAKPEPEPQVAETRGAFLDIVGGLRADKARAVARRTYY